VVDHVWPVNRERHHRLVPIRLTCAVTGPDLVRRTTGPIAPTGSWCKFLEHGARFRSETFLETSPGTFIDGWRVLRPLSLRASRIGPEWG
jgi:hypothetical protein